MHFLPRNIAQIRLFTASSFLIGLLSGTAKANLVFTNLRLTPTSFEVNILGTLPLTAPSTGAGLIYIVNPNNTTNPGFSLPDFAYDSSQSFTGTQTLSDLLTGGATFGDYMLVRFNNGLAPGENISGTVSGTWSSPVFNPSQISSLNFYWGNDEDRPVPADKLTSGAFLAAVPVNVPEPSATVLVVMAGLVTLRRR